MKYLLILLLAVSCKGQSHQSDDTVYYLIRHAEKDRSSSNNTNPHLNDMGKERAQEWKTRLGDKGIDAIYITDFNRTRETAAPLATYLNLEPKIYSATDLYSKNFKAETKGLTVLIVGHSNTTPAFVNSILNNTTYKELNDSNNGALFKVTFNDGKPQVSLQQFEDGF